MTEKELRQLVVNTAKSFLGCKESDGSHKKIIDLYNSHKPWARGYKVKYTDEWCSTFASAVAIKVGITDIFPTECGCEKHIGLFKDKGSWMEKDNYIPGLGDAVFYDWQDGANYATEDNTGRADHIGIVIEVSNSHITVIEGNMNNAVGTRKITINGRYIRGFGVPKYAYKASNMSTNTSAPSSPKNDSPLAVGDIVNFTGTKHYVSSNASNGRTCKPGKARVTAFAKSGKHPIHLVAQTGGGSNVYGWVDTAFVTRESTNLAVGAKVKVNSGAKTYTGVKLASFVYKNTYDVISISGDRVVIGTGKVVTAAMNKKDLTIV